MAREALGNLGQDLVDAIVCSFGVPGSEGGVAEPAAKVAAAGAHEHTGSAGQQPFPLETTVDFTDPQLSPLSI